MTTRQCWSCRSGYNHYGHYMNDLYDCRKCGANVRCRGRNCARDNGEGKFCSECGTARGAPSKRAKRCLFITWFIGLYLLGLMMQDVVWRDVLQFVTGQPLDDPLVFFVSATVAPYIAAVLIYVTARIGCRPSNQPVHGKRIGYGERFFYPAHYQTPYDLRGYHHWRY